MFTLMSPLFSSRCHFLTLCQASAHCRCLPLFPRNMSASQSFGNPHFNVWACLKSELKLFLCIFIWKALKLWRSALFFVCFFFFLSVLVLGSWRFDLNISSARTDQLVICTLYTDVSLCRKPPLAKLRHMNGMCVCFLLWRANLYTYEYINIHIF